jgi:hypothetical protein
MQCGVLHCGVRSARTAQAQRAACGEEAARRPPRPGGAQRPGSRGRAAQHSAYIVQRRGKKTPVLDRPPSRALSTQSGVRSTEAPQPRAPRPTTTPHRAHHRRRPPGCMCARNRATCQAQAPGTAGTCRCRCRCRAMGDHLGAKPAVPHGFGSLGLWPLIGCWLCHCNGLYSIIDCAEKRVLYAL